MNAFKVSNCSTKSQKRKCLTLRYVKVLIAVVLLAASVMAVDEVAEVAEVAVVKEEPAENKSRDLQESANTLGLYAGHGVGLGYGYGLGGYGGISA